MIGSSITIVGVFLSTVVLIDDFWTFQIFLTSTLAFGVGISFSCILYKAWIYFPGREGVISGIIIGGFGMGSLVFNLILEESLNPEGLKPVQIKDLSAS